MKFAGLSHYFIFLCLPFSFLCSNIDPPFNGILNSDLLHLDGRIINGTIASRGQFPHQVSLRRKYSNSHFCGGSVIDSEWVLTAAHCMYLRGHRITPDSISVTAGHVRLNQSDDFVQRQGVSAMIVHEDFDLETLTNDIALLKMNAPFNLDTTFVKAATMGKNMPNPGTNCQVSGWGYLAEGTLVASNDLMFIDLPLISTSECKELLVNITSLPPGMFCAGYKEGLRDACQGDSGGGMICDNTLFGIVSGGEGCARPALPGLYADVPYYYSWVMNQMTQSNYLPTEHSYEEI